MSDENVTDNWDEITDTELEKRLESEKSKREQEMKEDQNGISNGGGAEFRPRILQRPKEAPQKVTILKRPSSSTGSNQQQMSSKPQKSLEQREREYAEARRRILGSDAEANINTTEQIIKSNNYTTKLSPSSSSNYLPAYTQPSQQQRIPDNISRLPRGPAPGNGFNIRR